MTEIAPGWNRTPEGWIIIPRDIEYRRGLFPEGVFQHPAKFNCYWIEELVKAYTKPEDTILDPFAGTGTVALAALLDRNVIMGELEDNYLELLYALQAKWQSEDKPVHRLTLIQGDSRQTMKTLPDNSIDCCISSPPYPHLSMQFNTGKMVEATGGSKNVAAYKGGSMNFSRVNNRFLFNRMMKDIYRQLARVLKPEGLYISLTKDSSREGKRELLSAEIIREVLDCGLVYTGDWHKYRMPGGLGATINRSKGRDVIEEEDAIVFRKVKQ